MTATVHGPAVDRVARAALSRVFEPGSDAVQAAVAEIGDLEVWTRVRAGLSVPGLSPALVEGARGRAAACDPEQELARAAACGARLVVPGDTEWPERQLWWSRDPDRPVDPAAGADPDVLHRDEAPPLALWVRGERGLAETVERSVAVVGARAATPYGTHVATELAFGLADRGWTVVSGAAYGIDGAAHTGALSAQRAPTVAVLACGVDVAYPKGHDRLLGRILEQGLVVSEVPPGAAATRLRFLVRNRLIAALTVATVVVEAAKRSGSLSTARLAGALHRHVLAVPGPVTSAASIGTHGLLRTGATCVTCVTDVLEAAGATGEYAADDRSGPRDPRDELSAAVRRVLDAVPVRRAAGIASIAQVAGVSALVVQQVLPPLLVAGLVERQPDGWRLTTLGATGTAR
ncbi:MAG: DNA-processing protein DprA [Mycobacteriales bacterium]|nr:DNA-processing protein DprA [Mycobacteriales bacterium]